jgi:hypothetical protein
MSALKCPNRRNLNVKEWKVAVLSITRTSQLLVEPPMAWVGNSLFFEIDIKTQRVLFSWSALAHVPITDSQLPLYNPAMNTTFGSASNPWDYFHVNSVESVGDGYLVNGRHVWTSYMLNRTGGVEWWR